MGEHSFSDSHSGETNENHCTGKHVIVQEISQTFKEDTACSHF